MSLFGDDDNGGPTPRKAKASLFDDDQDDGNMTSSARTSRMGASIFAENDEEDNADESSPWGFTPRKKNGGRAGAGGGNEVVKQLLADADVPDQYIDVFEAVQTGRGQVDAARCRAILAESGIGEDEQVRVWNVVTGGNETVVGLGRGEFNVLLALIGLAQEGEELGLDAVDERRKRLPVPKLPKTMAGASAPQQARPASTSQPVAPPQQSPVRNAQPEPVAAKTPTARKSSFGAGFGESDPWGSPQLHKGHNHANTTTAATNGGVGSATGRRTTSTYTTTASETGEHSTYGRDSTVGGSSWGAGNSFAGNTDTFGGGAGGGFGDEATAATPRPPARPRVMVSKGVDEVITVSLLGEKEGLFLFQHRNYEVASVRRNSKVIRRYSDFVWLLDCLHKRYPFRQLPLLPPKRVAINGNHIAADNAFVEKRRRGLARFANALVRHPVLREEQLVVMFLTVPTELSVWRKQATISVQEEFLGKSLPPDLEDSLSADLINTFDTARAGARRSAELYINLCNLVERVCKRTDGLAAEYGRVRMNLVSIAETSKDTYCIDANDVPLLNEGLHGVAKHLGTSQNLLEDETRAWDEGVVEDLKTMRDALVSLREMFERRDRYAKDNIPQLERRIQQNEVKLQGIKAKGDAAKPGEAEKVENAIVADKQSIVDQHARGVFIKECIRDELLYFQTTQYHVSRLHQDWAQERVKYAELQADNFRTLVDAVENMPLEE